MTPERWRQISGIFHAAVTRAPDSRDAFLDVACGNDSDLRREIDGMLRGHANAGSFGEHLPADAFTSTAPVALPASDHPVIPAVRREPSRLRHPFAWLAIAAAVAVLFGSIYAVVVEIQRGWITKDFGWEQTYRGGRWIVGQVAPDGPAAALLRRDDRIIALNGVPPIQRAYGVNPQRVSMGPGTAYVLSVERGGARLDVPLVAANQGEQPARMLVYLFVVLAWCTVGVFLGLARPGDPLVRLAATAAVLTGVNYLDAFVRGGPLFHPLHLAVGCHFFCRFPTGKRLNGVWRVLLVPLYAVAVASTLVGVIVRSTLAVGGPRAVRELALAYPPMMLVRGGVARAVFFVAVPLMMAAVAWNYRHLTTEEDRRRVEWVVFGSMAALTLHAVWIASVPFGTPLLPLVQWYQPVADLCSAGIPVVVAYAVLKHRLFDVRVVIRRGLQYLFARGALQLLLAIPLLVVGGVVIRNRDQTIGALLEENRWYLGWIGGALLSLRYRGQIASWLDRRFFREHYDREHILLSIVDDVAKADSSHDLLQMARDVVEGALHPSAFHIWFRDPSPADSDAMRALVAHAGEPPPGLVSRLQQSTSAVDLTTASLSRAEWWWVERCAAHLLVPFVDTQERLRGMLVLGRRKSEEPYAAGDRRLLQAVANQVGLAYDRLRLRAQVDEDARVRHDVLARLDGRQMNVLKECPACGACYDGTVDRCDADGQSLRFSLPVERTIDRKYRLDRLLGRGGMGAVYDALDLRLKRRVAVKIVIGREPGRVVWARRVNREAEAAARLNHPNIVSIFDVGSLGATGAYLVMEQITGVTLLAELDRVGRLGPKQAREWFAQILDALASAHAQGVVHRDLKPENVMALRGPDTRVTVKVLDFGLAKVLSDETVPGTVTREGTIVGTVAYMAPEQLTGAPVDARADLFALGVMLVEALTGTLPFPARTLADRFATLDHRYHLAATRDGELALRHVLQGCLAREPGDRYESIARLRPALLSALDAL